MIKINHIMDNITCPKCKFSDKIIKRKVGILLDNEDEVVVSDFFIKANNPAGVSINKDDQLGLTLYQCNHCSLIFGIGEVLEDKTISTVDKFKLRLKEREEHRLGINKY